MALTTWDPADTNGTSEDWLESLDALTPEHPVLQTPTGYVVTQYDDVSRLLNDEALKVPVVEQYEFLGITGPMLDRAKRVILGMNGAPHHRLRTLVNRAFTPRAVASLADAMDRYLSDRLDTIGSGEVDILHGLVSDYPAHVIGEMLGVPEDDRAELARMSDAIVGAQFSMSKDTFGEFEAAAVACDAYLMDLVQAKRDEPDDSILTRIIQAEVEGDKLDDLEIVSIASSLLNAGMDTTRHQSCLALLLFEEQPDQWARLRAEPEQAANAVEEVLRFRPVTPLLTRLATERVDVAGVEIPPMSLIALSVATANRDPALNPGNGHVFDIDRASPRHLTFGFGPHYCVGAALARLELTRFLRAVADRLETITIAGPAPRRAPTGVYGVEKLVVRFP